MSARRTPSNRRLPSSRDDGTLIALSSSEDLIGDNPDGSNEILVHDTTDGTTTQPTAGPRCRRRSRVLTILGAAAEGATEHRQHLLLSDAVAAHLGR